MKEATLKSFGKVKSDERQQEPDFGKDYSEPTEAETHIHITNKNSSGNAVMGSAPD